MKGRSITLTRSPRAGKDSVLVNGDLIIQVLKDRAGKIRLNFREIGSGRYKIDRYEIAIEKNEVVETEEVEWMPV